MSEGFPRPPGAPFSTNLVQQFDYGLGLSRLLQIKERTPSPTLGSEIIPTIQVDDLQRTAFPTRRRCFFGRVITTVGGAGQRAWMGVNCRGRVGANAQLNDRLVVHDFTLHMNTGQIMELEVGRAAGVSALVGGFASYADSTIAAAVGTQRSDFTGGLSGESTDASDAFAQQFEVPNATSVLVKGPWIIGVGEAVFVHVQPGGIVGLTVSVLWNCEEFPAP